MTNKLQEIYEYKKIEVRNRKKILSAQEVCARIDCNKKPLDFAAALRAKIEKGQNALICEVKKASPSKGVLCKNFDAVEIAKTYENAGAACISVLTDEKYFQGCDQYLQEIRQHTKIPLLRKDFIFDEYQIYEAKMLGADCILLIVAMLDDDMLRNLENIALEAGLSVLIEIHNEEELSRALRLKSPLIGINNRNLKTLQIDLQTSLNLAPKIPQNRIIIGESGIKTMQDITKLNQVGINSFLIGEHFMLQKDIKKAVIELVC
ncbi:MAG TPA: indole-3-glycerol phosphate synthase TrpC [Rickettsiales bacterium]|nr:indole-3-glycerol phosphate synthase TrpC [Rickettsiales bacterium]